MNQPDDNLFPKSAPQLPVERDTQVYAPLVYSVCRRYLRRPEDIEDAAQETFLKLAAHAHEIRGSVRSWLTSTAYATSVDLIRRAARERRRREQLAYGDPSSADNSLVTDSIWRYFHDALLLLTADERELIVERFFKRTPLRVIAARTGLSVPTVSRRAATAVHSLAEILRGMGLKSADDLSVAMHLDAQAEIGVDAETEGLLVAPDWRAPGLTPLTGGGGDNPLAGTGKRPLRVGVFVSYLGTTIRDGRGYLLTTDAQVWSTQQLAGPEYQLVGIVEPGSTSHGLIERTLREYELTAGLVEVTDQAALATLDVILLGTNYAMEPESATAIVAAVRGGVGLLNEWWNDIRSQRLGADYCDLMLADSQMFNYHMPEGCGNSSVATVLEEHPLLAGVTRGTSLLVTGCGPAYRVKPDATVLIAKDRPIPPSIHKIPGDTDLLMPVFIVGKLGKGRVIVVNHWDHRTLPRLMPIHSGYFPRLINWLAPTPAHP